METPVDMSEEAKILLRKAVYIKFDFLGSHWNFAVMKDGTHYWVHDSGVIIPSEGNR